MVLFQALPEFCDGSRGSASGPKTGSVDIVDASERSSLVRASMREGDLAAMFKPPPKELPSVPAASQRQEKSL